MRTDPLSVILWFFVLPNHLRKCRSESSYCYNGYCFLSLLNVEKKCFVHISCCFYSLICFWNLRSFYAIVCFHLNAAVQSGFSICFQHPLCVFPDLNCVSLWLFRVCCCDIFLIENQDPRTPCVRALEPSRSVQ